MPTSTLHHITYGVLDLASGEVSGGGVDWRPLRDATDGQIIEDLLELEKLNRLIRVYADDLRFALKLRMEKRGATEVVTKQGTAALKDNRPYYSQPDLDVLLELLPEEELVDAGAYVPEHEKTETVERKWNATKLKRFAKRGRDIKDVIEGARRVDGQRLVVDG